MMDAAPTEALPAILAQLRGEPLQAPPAMRALDVSDAEAGDGVSAAKPTAVAPPPATAEQLRAMQSGRARLLRNILTCHFERHVPDGLYKVEDLVARVVGGPPTAVEGSGGTIVGGVLWSEAELFAKLEAKYGKRVALDPHSLE